MCDSNIPSVSLQTAVIMQIQEFATSQQQFSRYDITLALRRKCNDGLLELTDCPRGNNISFDIRKAAVDAIFDQLWANGLCDGIPALDCNYDRNLGYRIYSATNPSQMAPVPTPTPVAASLPPLSAIQAASAQPTLPTPSVSSPAPLPPSRPANVVSLSDAEIRRRISTYMQHCQTVGMQPSLKQIQSAIKRGNRSTGLSYREIANVATSLGFKV